MKDYLPVSPLHFLDCRQLLYMVDVGDAYGKLPTAPEPLNHAQMVECHGCEEDLGAVGVAELPGEQPPELAIIEEMRTDLDPAEDFCVG